MADKNTTGPGGGEGRPGGGTGGQGAKPAAGGAKPGRGTGAGGLPRAGWVSRLVSDPANVPAEEPVVLAGYPGDSDEPGHTRIYCGPALDHYVDVADEDIIHHEAADEPGAPPGNVLVWVKKSAQVHQGTRGQQKSKGSFFEGPVMQNHMRRRGGTGGGTGSGGPAPTQPGACVPNTMFGCSILCTQVCLQGTGGGAGMVGPTGWLGCTVVGPTAWLGCGQPSHLIGCTAYLHCPPTNMPGCPNTSTCTPTAALGCPSTSTCPPELAGTGGGQSTAATVCTQIGCAPTSGFGCPRTSTCPPTFMPGCPSSSTCTPETSMIGCPGTSTCTPGGGMGGGLPATAGFGCPRTSTCPPTYRPGCPDTSTCTPGAAGGGVDTTVMPINTARCPSFGFTCTYVHCPPPTGMLGCPPTSTCTPTVVGCPGTYNCPSAVDACPTRIC